MTNFTSAVFVFAIKHNKDMIYGKSGGLIGLY